MRHYFFRFTAPSFILVIVISLTSCLPSRKESQVEAESSKTMTFKRKAVMDTITAVIEGKAVTLIDDEAITGVRVSLSGYQTNYQVISDSAGRFRFNHIAAGDYKVLSIAMTTSQ